MVEVQQHLGNNWVRAVAMSTTDGLARGLDAVDTGAPITVPVGAATLGRVFDVLGHPIDGKGAVKAEMQPADPPRAAGLRPDGDRGAGLRDRHQGHRPHRPVPTRRQGRRLRRRRHRQDGHHPGADPQHRRRARWLLGLRRRRRAVTRGQRPARRDDGVRRHRQDRHGLRPDERAAGRAPARRPDGARHGRVLPRRGGARHPPLHRQHLPLHPGRLRGLGAPRPHAIGGGLPADAGDRDGRPPGAHHLHEEGLDHLAAGHLRAGRRLHRSGARDDLRPPRLDDPPRALDRGAGDLPGRRPADLDLHGPRSAHRRRRALRGLARGAAHACSATRTSRTSSRSSAWTS